MYASYLIDRDAPCMVWRCMWAYRFSPVSYRLMPQHGLPPTLIPAAKDDDVMETVPPLSADLVCEGLCCF